MVLRLWQIRPPGVALVRRAYVVSRVLLLHEGGCVEVGRGGVATFHVGHGHLGSEAGLHRALILHLGHLLCLSRVQQIKLLHLAIGRVCVVELAKIQACVRA